MKLKRRVTRQPVVPDRCITHDPLVPLNGVPASGAVIIIVIIATAVLVALGRPAAVSVEVLIAAGIGAVEILRRWSLLTAR